MSRSTSYHTPDHQPDTAPEPETHTDAPACPGRCNSGWRAAEARTAETGIRHDYEPRQGQPVWCPPCTTLIRGALCDTPELAVRLQIEIDSGAASSATEEEIVNGSKERALHEHQAPVFALEELSMWLADWEDTVRSVRHLPERHPQRTQHKTVEVSSLFLRHHLDWILTEHDREAAEGFGLELLGLHRKTQILTRTHDVLPERCYGVACPYCDKNALEWEVDELGMATGNVKCRKCRPILRMTPVEYERWTKMFAADVHARGYAPMAKLREVFGGSIPSQFAKSKASA